MLFIILFINQLLTILCGIILSYSFSTSSPLSFLPHPKQRNQSSCFPPGCEGFETKLIIRKFKKIGLLLKAPVFSTALLAQLTQLVRPLLTGHLLVFHLVRSGLHLFLMRSIGSVENYPQECFMAPNFSWTTTFLGDASEILNLWLYLLKRPLLPPPLNYRDPGISPLGPDICVEKNEGRSKPSLLLLILIRLERKNHYYIASNVVDTRLSSIHSNTKFLLIKIARDKLKNKLLFHQA